MNDIQTGESPKEEDLFYKQWGWESLKESISIINDVLKIFITIDIAILSAFLGFYDKISMDSFTKIILFIVLIISLFFAIVGIYPFPTKVKLNVPNEVKCYKQERMRFKSICLALSAILLLSIFVIAVITLISIE